MGHPGHKRANKRILGEIGRRCKGHTYTYIEHKQHGLYIGVTEGTGRRLGAFITYYLFNPSRNHQKEHYKVSMIFGIIQA